MKAVLLASILIVSAFSDVLAAATPGKKVRTLQNSPGRYDLVLKNSLGRGLYRSLMISPIEAWIIVKADVVNSRLVNRKIVQSEANGVWDKMALAMGENSTLSGMTRIGSFLPNHPVLLHLLIYDLRDGKMALSFLYPDRPGDLQTHEMYNMASVAVLKNGKWVEVTTPKTDRRGGLMPGP